MTADDNWFVVCGTHPSLRTRRTEIVASVNDASRVRECFQGCLLGGAVGDALGAPVEFRTLDAIRREFGPGGIRDFAPAYGRKGAITDDTQMTLFTAEGLIRSLVRGSLRGIVSYRTVTARAYIRWLMTQGERSQVTLGFAPDETGWLFAQHELHHRRAPGNTCLGALRAMRSLDECARNDSKGCGGVMRMAPVGLFVWHRREQASLDEAFALGTDLAGITHGHPTGQLAAGALAALVFALVDGASLPDALIATMACLKTLANHEETRGALQAAEELAAGKLPHDEAIARLGEGWVAEEALAIAVYCSLVATSFEEGVVLAVNHSGDSDSTGSIAGNILGTMHGVRAIPARWLQDLELRTVIEELANDLFDCATWQLSEDMADTAVYDRVRKKYPGL